MPGANLYQLYSQAQQPIVPAQPRDPYSSPARAATAGFFEGVSKELTSTLVDTAGYWAAGLQGQEINEEQFAGIVGDLAPHLEFREGMTDVQAQHLAWMKENELRRLKDMAGGRGGFGKAVAMAGTFAGTFADPINILSLAVPILRAENFVKPAARFSPMLSNILKKNDTVLQSARLGAFIGFTEAVVREPFILGGQKQIQGEYDWNDSLMNLAAAPAFGAVLGGAMGGARNWLRSRIQQTLTPDLDADVSRWRFEALKEDPQIQQLKFEVESLEDRMRLRLSPMDPKHSPLSPQNRKKLAQRSSQVERLQGVQTRFTERAVWAYTQKGSKTIPDFEMYRLQKPLKRNGKILHPAGSDVSEKTLESFGLKPQKPSRIPTDTEVRNELRSRGHLRVGIEGQERSLNISKPINRWTNKDWEAASGKKRSELTEKQIRAVKVRLEEARIKARQSLIAQQQDADVEAEVVATSRENPEYTQKDVEEDIRLYGKRSIFYDSPVLSPDEFVHYARKAQARDKQVRDYISRMNESERAEAEDPVARARKRAHNKIKRDAYNKASHEPNTVPQKFLATLLKSTFGRKVRFFDNQAAIGVFEAQGLVTNKDFATIYIREDTLSNMLFIAGHEMAHSIKYQDPGLYRKLTVIITEWDELHGGAIIDEALKGVYARQGDGITRVTDHQLIEEAFNDVFAHALTQPAFWRHLQQRNATLFEKIMNWLTELQDKFHYIVNGVKQFSARPGERHLPEVFRELDDMYEQLAHTVREVERVVGPRERTQIKSARHNAAYLAGVFDKHIKNSTLPRFYRWLEAIDQSVEDINESTAFEGWQSKSTVQRVGDMDKTWTNEKGNIVTTNPINRAMTLAQKNVELTPREQADLEARIFEMETQKWIRSQANTDRYEANKALHKLRQEGYSLVHPRELTDPEAILRAEQELHDFDIRYKEAAKAYELAEQIAKEADEKYKALVQKALPESPIIWRTDPKNPDKWEFFFVSDSEGARFYTDDEAKTFASQGRKDQMEHTSEAGKNNKRKSFEGEEFQTPWQEQMIKHSARFHYELAKNSRYKKWKATRFERTGDDIYAAETRREYEVAQWINDAIERKMGETKGPWSPMTDPGFVRERLKIRTFRDYMKAGYDMDISEDEAWEWINEAFWSMYSRYDSSVGDFQDIAKVTGKEASFSPERLNRIAWEGSGRETPIYYRGDHSDPDRALAGAFEDEVYQILSEGADPQGRNQGMDDYDGFTADRMRLPEGTREALRRNPLKKVWNRLKLKQRAENLNLTRIKNYFEQKAGLLDLNDYGGRYVGSDPEEFLSDFTRDERKLIMGLADGSVTQKTYNEMLDSPDGPPYSARVLRLANRLRRWRRTREITIDDFSGFLRETRIDLRRYALSNADIQSAVSKLSSWAAMSEGQKASYYQKFLREWSRYSEFKQREGKQPENVGFRKYLEAEVARESIIELERMVKEEALVGFWKAKSEKLGDRFPKWVSAYFDGVWKKGMKPNESPSSFESIKQSQVSRDTALWMQTAQKHNVLERLSNRKDPLFEQVIAYHESGRNRDLLPENPQEARIIEDLAEAVQLANKAQVAGMREHGANVRYNKTFWHTQKHNRSRIVADQKGWMEWMLENVDWERVWTATGRDVHSRNRQGNIDYLKEVYTDIDSNRLRDLDPDDPDFIRNMSKEVVQDRTIHFKQGKSFEYDKLYGSGEPYRSYLDGLQRRAELTAIFGEFGPNPDKMWRLLMAETGMNPKAGGVANPQAMFDYATGKMDDPVDGDWAQRRSTVMQLANATFLGFSGISGLVDTAHSIAALRYLGTDLGKFSKNYWKALYSAHKRQGDAQKTGFFRYLGAGADVLLNSASRRMHGDAPVGNAARRMNNFTFTANGLNYWTVIAQEALVDVLTRTMGDANFAAKHPAFMRTLEERYGITPEEFGAAHTYRKNVEGLDKNDSVTRLSPDMFELEHPQLANKFRNFLEDWIRQGVIEPDATSQVWTRLGMRDGEPLGSTIRVMSQYMSFGMATYRKTYMRMLNAYGEQGFMAMMKDPRSRRTMDMLSFMGWSLALGYISMNIKEILRGREPVHFGNFNRQTAKRWAFQSGVAGPISDMFWVRDGGDVTDIFLGPSIGAAKDIGEEVLSFDVRGSVYETERNFPGATLPVLGELRKRMFAPITGDAYINSQQAISNLFDQEILFSNADEDTP